MNTNRIATNRMNTNRITIGGSNIDNYFSIGSNNIRYLFLIGGIFGIVVSVCLYASNKYELYNLKKNLKKKIAIRRRIGINSSEAINKLEEIISENSEKH